MRPHIDIMQVNPSVRKALLAVDRYLHGSSLGSGLQHLLKVRASQINGCARCLEMHTKDARAEGESEQRLYALDAWRETPFFDERERAALEWTEALTRVTKAHVPDDVYELVKQHFTQANSAISHWPLSVLILGTV